MTPTINDALKLYSVQVMLVISTVIGVWGEMPAEMKASIMSLFPAVIGNHANAWFALISFGALVWARLKPQPTVVSYAPVAAKRSVEA